MPDGDFRSTRRMIFYNGLLIPCATLLLLSTTLLYYFATNLSYLEDARLVGIADGYGRLIEQFLRERSADLRYIADSSRFEEVGGQGRLPGVLEQLQLRAPAFLDIGILDNRGSNLAYAGPHDLKARDYVRSEWCREVEGKGVYISDVFLGYMDRPSFAIGVRRDEGEHLWCLQSTTDFSFFSGLLESVSFGKTGEAYLINDHGVFQTRRRSGGNIMEMDPDHAVYRAARATIGAFRAKDHRGRRHVYAMGRISSTGWLLVVRQDIGEARAPLIRAVLIGLIVIVVGGAAAFSIAFMLASRVSRQLALAEVEKRRTAAELLVAGRLAELGHMSAWIAHEINNPLEAIKSEESYVRDILGEMEQDQTADHSENLRLLRESIDQIGVQVSRSKQITGGLFDFARRSETEVQRIDLRSLLSVVVRMVKPQAKAEKIRIVQEFEPNLPHLWSDPTQLKQVFLNLLNNAVDALKESRGGEIRITAARSIHGLTVSVADNGCGIPPEHIERIFLPFFTTKPVGQGTGLGLNTCYGIVENLGGRITVASEPHMGSVFTVQLPLDGPPANAA